MSKANLKVDGMEVTVYFQIRDGKHGDCFYCHQDGAVEQLAIVEEILTFGRKLDQRAKFYDAVETRLREILFSGRALHRVDSPCQEKWIQDIRAHAAVVVFD